MPDTPRTSSAAAVVLVGLAVLSPWPFGSTLLVITRGIVLVAASAALVGVLGAWRYGQFVIPSGVRWWMLAWMLGALQLVPLPAAVHQALAPGSAAVWHPAEAAAAAVLGPGPRPISVYPGATLRWLAFAAAVVGLVLAARIALHTRERLLLVASVVAGSGLLVTVYALVARLFFGNRLYGVFEVPTVAPFGPFVSKNHFAGYVEMAACLAVGLAVGLADEARRDSSWLSWLESRRSGLIIAAWGVAGVLTIAVPVSLSRGGMLSLAAGLVAFAAMRFALSAPRATGRTVDPPAHRARYQLAAVLLLGLLAGLAALGVLLPEEARSRLATLSAGTRTDSYRMGVWKDSLSLAASSPLLGSGFGAYGDALPRFKTAAGELRVEHAENDYVELLCEGGLLGFAAVVLGTFILFRCAWSGVQEEPRRLARAIRVGALAGLATLLAHCSFDFILRVPSNALMAAVLFACGLAPVSVPRAPSDPDGAPEPAEPPASEGFGLTGGRLPSTRKTAQSVGIVLAVGSLCVSFAIAARGAWHPSCLDTGSLLRTVDREAGLRRAVTERDVVAALRARPSEARTWLALAWLRIPKSRADAANLALWASRVEPSDRAVRIAARRIVAFERTATR